MSTSPTHVVVTVGVGDDVVVAIEEQADVRVQPVDAEDVVATLSQTVPVAVVAAADSVGLAQIVHRAAPDAAVVLLACDADEQDKLTAALATTPGIGRYTLSLRVDSVEELVEELRWALRRAEHQETVSVVRHHLRPFMHAAPEVATRYLSQLFEHAPMGIIVADPTGLVRAANAGCAALTGRRVSDIVGTGFSGLFTGEHAALANDLLTDCISTGDTAVQTLTRRGPDGRTQHIEVTVAAADPETASLGAFILLHDESARIDALEAAEHARQQAEAAASRYANLSRTLQRSLLPPGLPAVDGFDVAARYHAAGDGTLVGGDFYDAFRIVDGRWCVVLGDVSGKGVGAAALTSLARYTLRTAALFETSPNGLFGTLNRVVAEDTRGEDFCTLAAIIVAPDGSVQVAVAGHPAPVVIRADGTLEPIGEPAPPVGLFDQIDVQAVATRLAVGDSIIVTSDGVTEARTPSGEFVDDLLDRVLPNVAGQSAATIAAAVDGAVVAVERARTRDDVTIVVISRTG